MTEKKLTRLQVVRKKVSPFYDPRAWVLIVLCAGGVAIFDVPMVKTILQWTLMFGIFAGFAVIISRFIFNQIDLTAHVKAALRGNNGAGLVVLGVLIFMGLLIMSLTFWGKA